MIYSFGFGQARVFRDEIPHTLCIYLPIFLLLTRPKFIKHVFIGRERWHDGHLNGAHSELAHDKHPVLKQIHHIVCQIDCAFGLVLDKSGHNSSHANKRALSKGNQACSVCALTFREEQQRRILLHLVLDCNLSFLDLK